MRYSIVTTTCSTHDEAKALTQLILEAKLAACVQVSDIESSYIWQGEIQHASEVKLTIKTKEGLYNELETLIEENHPYETPQIVQIPIKNGFDDYLVWIDEVMR
jgi:periplasmic divalent cation tolerance protein